MHAIDVHASVARLLVSDAGHVRIADAGDSKMVPLPVFHKHA